MFMPMWGVFLLGALYPEKEISLIFGYLSFLCAKFLDRTHYLTYHQNMCSVIETSNQITILLGRQQAATGERMSLRKLAEVADVPKDFLYRLDAGTARHVSLESLARLCDTLNCTVQDILILERADGESL